MGKISIKARVLSLLQNKPMHVLLEYEITIDL